MRGCDTASISIITYLILDLLQIILQEMNNFAHSLDERSFSKYVDLFRKFKTDTEQRTAEENSKKRKIEKQTYPNKK